MRRLLRVGLIATASVVIVCVAMYAAARFILFPHPCDHFETVLSRHVHGRSVAYVFQACTTIGASNQACVDLIPSTGRRIRIFSYVPWGGEISYKGVSAKGPFEPTATWVALNELRISIGTVDQVLQRRTEADGVHVTYDIGSELYRRQLGPSDPTQAGRTSAHTYWTESPGVMARRLCFT